MVRSGIKSRALGASPERKYEKIELVSHGMQSSMGRKTQTAKFHPADSRFHAWLITMQAKLILE